MLISLNLLKSFIDLEPVITPEELAERLTFAGSEVESINYTSGKLSGVVAARIDALEVHPEEHKYYIAHLDTGTGIHKCVTSAKNMKKGDLVFYAGLNSILPNGAVMGVRDFAGVQSAGMMLSAEELGLDGVDDPSGLLILPEDARPGDDANNLFHINDVILDVSITPNRGDLLSHLGFARELKGLYPRSVLKSPQWLRPINQDKDWSVKFGTISLPDKGCINYRLGLATGAKISESPLTIKVDLSHLGMRPINNAVDVTNYVMLMLGQPLHAFDLNTLPEREITVRAAHENEHITTLDEKERILNENDLLITSGNQAIALAGVMGGSQTGINDDTSTIIVESASFSPVRVGLTSRRLGINSEAAYRFSRTVDPALSKIALTGALNLLHEWSGAEVDYHPLSAENAVLEPQTIKLTRHKLSVYLGFDDMNEAARILENFGIKHTGEDKFLPPSYRPDINIEEDLIEEIGRFRGYNETENALPGRMSKRGETGSQMMLSEAVRNVLISRGYTELMTYSFLPEDFCAKLLIPSDDKRSQVINIANPISREQISMRSTLIYGLLSSLSNSLSSGYRDVIKIFEQGRVFIGNNEPEHIAGLIFNGLDTRSIFNERCEDFYDMKADIEALITSRGYKAVFKPESEPFTHSGQCAGVYVDDVKIGFAGRLKPSLEQKLNIENVYIFELDLTNLIEPRKPEYKSLSQFPAVFRDIAILAEREKMSADVMKDIISSVSELLADSELKLDSVRLFDIYEGKNIPEGFKSLAYSLSYRSDARTLTDTEVDSVHNQVRGSLKQKGYTIR